VIRRTAATLLAAVLLVPAAGAQTRGGTMTGVANPSAVIGTEIAFARLAQAKGQWTAFRDTMAVNDAVLFEPAKVVARDWLKGRRDPAEAVRWQVHEVWMSCDGTYAISRGAWQLGKDTGVFNTVWQRQPRSGEYLWVLDLGDTLSSPLAAPDMIGGHVSECRNRPHRPVPAVGKKPSKLPPAIDAADGQSEDGTLRWRAAIDAKGAGTFVVGRWNGSGYDEAERLTISGR
jgi:hypothetical protein